MYDNLIKKEDNVISRKVNDIKIINNYIDGGFVEIVSELDKNFKVEFFSENGNIEYSCDMKSNMWCRTNKKYFEKYTCKVRDLETGETIYDETYDATGKTVLISLDSKSLGDTMAWFPYVEEFRKKWDCEVICSTFWNSLFEDQYPDIKFVNPGFMTNNLYAHYKIGLYFKDGKIDRDKHKVNPTKISLLQMSADILGIDYVEVKPILRAPRVEKRKRVGIGVHSTAQTKYWNNATGWQEVTDYLISEGYEVVVISKEGDGYMGNYYPKGTTKLPEESVEDLIDNLHSCEFFIGLSSGLSWLAWATGIPVVLISGFTSEDLEPKKNVVRIMNKSACTDCWSRHKFDPGDWNWCPDHKGTDRQFECSKLITGKMVIDKILSNNLLGNTGIVEVEVSLGELLDKLTILKIKMDKISDPEKLVHIEKEYLALFEKSNTYLKIPEISSIVDELLVTNSKLWVIEDILRDLEAESRFDEEFIENARLVYITNDHRFSLKNKINKATNSSIQEQKSYKNYGKKKKVAVLLTGYMRTFHDCVGTWKNLMDNEMYEFDFFVHTYKSHGFTKGWNDMIDSKDVVDIERLKETLNIKKIEIEDEIDNHGARIPSGHSKSRVKLMFRKFFLCNELLKEHVRETGEEYEFVIRMRPDLVFSEKVILEKPSPNSMITSKYIFGNSYSEESQDEGINDQIAICSIDSIDSYSNIFNAEEHLFVLQPETALHRYINDRNIDIRYMDLKMNIRRND